MKVLGKNLKKQFPDLKLQVIGIEKNPEAHEMCIKNIKLNKISETTTSYLGDVNDAPEILKNCKLNKFSRIIMPAPFWNENFIETALKLSDFSKNVVFHIYDHLKIKEIEKTNEKWKSEVLESKKELEKKVLSTFSKFGSENAKILQIVECNSLGSLKFLSFFFLHFEIFFIKIFDS